MAGQLALVREPRSLMSCIPQARTFFHKCNEGVLYEHGHDVLTRARNTGIVESTVINDPREDTRRRLANSDLAILMLYHTIQYDKLRACEEAGTAPQLPPELYEETIRGQLEIFSILTRLNRTGAQLSEYKPILINGDAPLALLALLADYAVSHTHQKEEELDGFIAQANGTIFRRYRSREDMKSCMENDARAGETILAPLAELFGYPVLAGDIIEQAYRIRHPNIYKHVTGLFEDGQSLEQLAYTQTVARRLAKRLKKILETNGFEVDVETRLQKHPGKVMRKIWRKINEAYDELDMAERTRMQREGYIEDNVLRYKLSSIHDPVALRVILRKFCGTDIDSMHEAEKTHVIGIAKNIISMTATTFSMFLLHEQNIGYTYSTRETKKANGYCGIHFDTAPKQDNELHVLLPFEIQLKTAEWDDIARHGKAAHYLYLGGDSEFIDMIKQAYLDTVMKIVSNGNGKNHCNSTK